MSATPKLKDEFNPLLPGLTDAQLLGIFIDAARDGIMETFRLMPLDKQRKFINLVDPRRPESGSTALIAATLADRENVVLHLMSLKPDLSVTDNNGWAPLAAAAWRGNERLVTLFLDKGANIDARDHEGWTALSDAISGTRPGTVMLLLARGANPLIANNDKMTPLDIAEDVKMTTVIPALREAVIRHNTRGAVAVMGQISNDIVAPAPAKFRKRP